VDIIGRPHTEDDGTQEDTGGEHRPELKAHRRCYSAEGFQFGAIARFASLKSASHTPAAPPLGGALLLVQIEYSGANWLSLAATFVGASSRHQTMH
jgi:hypothetical protein